MNYKSLQAQFAELMTGRWITDMSNASAFLMMEFPRINWVGFYLFDGKKLVLGPFQGKPACTDIELNRGVCGEAARTQKTKIVKDVHDFPDHIVCDPSSRSEIVIPLIIEGNLIGVLDVDSPEIGRFDLAAQNFFQEIARILLEKSKPQLYL